jgi:hypothetical protein
MGDRALLDTIRGRAVAEALRWAGHLEVGDGCRAVYAVSCSVELIRCERVTMVGLKVYIPKGWGAGVGWRRRHVWRDCYFGPRPGTSQWQGGEGFMFCATRYGTTLDGIVMRHTGDERR